MSQQQDIFRVYRRDWLIAHVATQDDSPHEAMIAAAQAFFDSHFAGRVHDDDVQLVPVGVGPHARVQLELRLPTLKAEWKTRELAEQYVAEQGWTDATIVERNGRADHELRGYGVKKLPQS